MMRTVEVLFVIIIIVGAFIVASQFAVLPSPRQIFGTNLKELAVSTLQTLDAKYNLSRIVFSGNVDDWGALQKALSASLPPNIVYNLTVFNINSTGGFVNYYLMNSISNAGGNLGVGSEAASCLVTSPTVTFSITPEKIGGSKPRTLYILNCSDANGWWITGYTGQSLAADLYTLLSPYFQTTILINSTAQLELLLNNSTQIGGTIQNAVVINTFGEAVPIPGNYCQGGSRESEGYVGSSYAKYCHTLGIKTRVYNWTWVSIVGYPVYYVTNTNFFTGPNDQNTYGIYGMKQVGAAGLNNFLRGLDNQGYSSSDTQWLTADIREQLQFTSEARDLSNYYGIYPAPSPMASRALPVTGSNSIVYNYNLIRRATMFELKTVSGTQYCPAATFSHNGGGALTAIGLTRTPDIRITVLDLLMFYRPTIYRSEFGASDTSRLVTLQLAQQGGT